MPHRPDDASPAPAHRSAAEQARFVALLTDMFEQRISFNEVLGLRVQSLAAPAPSLRFDMRPGLVGHFLYGRLHGGVISAVLDATAGQEPSSGYLGQVRGPYQQDRVIASIDAIGGEALDRVGPACHASGQRVFGNPRSTSEVAGSGHRVVTTFALV